MPIKKKTCTHMTHPIDIYTLSLFIWSVLRIVCFAFTCVICVRGKFRFVLSANFIWNSYTSGTTCRRTPADNRNCDVQSIQNAAEDVFVGGSAEIAAQCELFSCAGRNHICLLCHVHVTSTPVSYKVFSGRLKTHLFGKFSRSFADFVQCRWSDFCHCRTV